MFVLALCDHGNRYSRQDADNKLPSAARMGPTIVALMVHEAARKLQIALQILVPRRALCADEGKSRTGARVQQSTSIALCPGDHHR